MLVLTRKTDQSFRIGNDVEVQILSSSKGKVKLAINAPRSIPVVRSELDARDGEASPGGNAAAGSNGARPAAEGKETDGSGSDAAA